MGITVKEQNIMNNRDIYNQIADIEREIAMLPSGSITKKKIKGNRLC